ncbi:MAG TPA: ABC transporter permease [Candidatus Angelobacter sp.]|jgi:peptide/nickel transport system permease protein|nr:ABC transporter permease [Candidatus Angelobacter sp.]
MFRVVLLKLLRLLAILLLAGLIGATLMRIAPGFTADEQQLNSNLSERSLEAIRQARLENADLSRFYLHYLSGLMRGDLGVSQSLNQPVAELLHERLPSTLRSLAIALALAWMMGMALATAVQLIRSRAFALAAEGLSAGLISTPAAVLALVFVVLRWPPALAASVLILPKIYRYCSNLLQESYELPHILVARAKGAGQWRVLAWHVAPTAIPQIVALVGVSISIAIGVLLPIEVICDVPGIGQLAWLAAESRDLPLLVNLTLIVTCLTVCATTVADVARQGFARRTA